MRKTKRCGITGDFEAACECTLHAAERTRELNREKLLGRPLPQRPTAAAKSRLPSGLSRIEKIVAAVYP